MNLRSFVRPSSLPVGQPPAVGEATPSWPEPRQSACVIAFLRHVGCPFAEATVRTMREVAAVETDLDWWVVSQGSTDSTERWCRSFGGRGGVRVLADETHGLYAAWGLPLSSARHFLGARSLLGVARLALRGVRNRRATGTRWQTAGAFAVDASGIVRWRHLPRHAADLPDLNAAVAALKQKAVGA
jgi:hypothetical protein